jgi:hypothetical protein
MNDMTEFALGRRMLGQVETTAGSFKRVLSAEEISDKAPGDIRATSGVS